jgi:acetyl esterase/lipase
VIDLDNPDDKTTVPIMREYLPNHGTPDELDMVNVVKHVTKDFPPAFVMTCTGDFLSGQAPLLLKTLMENKVPHIFRFYGGSQKELGHVFHCNIKMKEANICNQNQCDFFRSLMEDNTP